MLTQLFVVIFYTMAIIAGKFDILYAFLLLFIFFEVSKLNK